MWEAFWVQNFHYVTEVFVAFLMVTAAWIYFDGWLAAREPKTFIRSLSFAILGLWSFAHAIPEGIEIPAKVISENLIDWTGFLGFFLLFLSLIIDPVPVKPGQESKTTAASAIAKKIIYYGIAVILLAAVSMVLAQGWPGDLTLVKAREIILKFASFVQFALANPKIFTAFFGLVIPYLLWIHYVIGIQKEWKFFFWGFTIIAFSLILSLASIWQNTSNVLLAQIIAPYRAVWVMEHIVKLIGVIMLAAWAWGFIRFRIFPQIFVSMLATSFLIFAGITILYTSLFLNQTQQSSVENLEKNLRTLNFALEEVKKSSILAARITAANPKIVEAMKQKNKQALFENLNSLMFENGTDFMWAVNAGGEVIVRAEDKEHAGDSVAEDPVVWRAFDGKASVTASVQSGVALPNVVIKAASPIVDITEGGTPEIIGAIVTGFILDTAFVDGFKQISSLDMTVYAQNVSAATTFTVPGSKFRMISAYERDEKILDTVLKKGKIYTGAALILNQPYLAAYVPLKDIEETTIGMLFTGISNKAILALATNTIQRTFVFSIVLMILSILPLWWLANFITKNQQV